MKTSPDMNVDLKNFDQVELRNEVKYVLLNTGLWMVALVILAFLSTQISFDDLFMRLVFAVLS